MSYLPISDYYGSSSSSQHDQRRYATSGENTDRSNPYQSQTRSAADGRQSQYGLDTYGWSGHNQNVVSSNAQNTYANNPWHDRSNVSTTYDYQREINTSAEQMSLNNQVHLSRNPYNSQNAHNLNHLAYASALNSPVPPSNSGRSSHIRSKSPYTTSSIVATAQIRTTSPANSASRYSTNLSQALSTPAYTAQGDDSASLAHNCNLALNAAAAITGAVREIHSQRNQQPSTSGTSHASNSPMMGAAQSTVQYSNQSMTPTYTTGHQRTPSSQARQATPSTNAQVRTASKNTTRVASQSEKRQTSLPSQPANDGSQAPVHNIIRQQSVALHPQSIANLVSSSKDTERVQESVENQDTMPNYIDPTQVFNPYHREYERKKRKAAEVEARRKSEERRLAEENRKASEELAKKASEPSVTANSKSKIMKKGQLINPSIDNQHESQPPRSPPFTVPSEDLMATEMQKMMAKMKEFRSSNPMLFQKLWNDMRGGASINTTASATTAQPPSPVVTEASLPTEKEQSSTLGKSYTQKSEVPITPPAFPTNGFKVLVENNPEGLPDLGRFPAERQVRQSYGKHKSDTPAEARQPPDQPPLSATSRAQSKVAPPARPVDTAVAWPEPRRRAVAIAAIHLLKSNPDNMSILITVQDISSLLERNPSYLDLCTALESRGLKFQRSIFARELLKGVPELQTPTPKTSAAPAEEIATINSVAKSQSSAVSVQLDLNPQTLLQAAHQPLSKPHGSSQSGMVSTVPPQEFTAADGVKSEQFKVVARHSEKGSKGRAPIPGRPEPPLGSKEAAAKKRDFSELIDLTALGNDDNYVLPTKQPRLDSLQMPGPFKQLETSTRTGFNANPSEPLKFDPQPKTQNQYLPTPTPSSYLKGPHISQPLFDACQQQPAQQHAGKSRMILAKKLDRSEALQKPYYDPKTVARDILIASGRHPSERPLNLHLAGLIGSLIDLDSDVSTFDWDAIDPGGPPPPKVDCVNIPAAPPRFKLGERVHRKRARLTIIDKTRQPNEGRRKVGPTSEAPTHSHAASPVPSPATPSVCPKKHPGRVNEDPTRRLPRRDDEKLANDTGKSTPTNRKISIDIPIHSSQRSARSLSHQVADPNAAMQTDRPLPVKRRGRPPGAKNKYPSVAAMKEQARATVIETPVEEAPEPILHSYRCRWVRCRAELHNLDTLRRHVLKKHTPQKSETSDGDLVCWWKKCQYLEPDEEGNLAPNHMFKDLREWSSHIEKDHVRPIALKYGDGPKTTHTGKQKPIELDLSKFLYHPRVGNVTRTSSHADPQSIQSARERYLADTDGRATTPLVSPDGNSDLPPDAMVLTRVYPQGPKTDKEKADVTGQNAFMKAHGNKYKDTRKAAEEVVRAMEVRKQKIGPGLDRGGCTLINEARRSTFMQAPGISRVVDAEY